MCLLWWILCIGSIKERLYKRKDYLQQKKSTFKWLNVGVLENADKRAPFSNSDFEILFPPSVLDHMNIAGMLAVLSK